MNRPAPGLRPAVLITGASSGIGAALAGVFAAHGHELLLVARRENRLVQLAEAIAATKAPRPHLLGLDLTTPGAAARIASAFATLGLEPQYVVNNAGFGLLGEAAKLDGAEQLRLVDLNVRVLVELSLAFVDSLGRNRGGILNVGSIAGFLPGPGMAAYYASKAFVLSFSEALHEELAGRDIRVTVLCPGPVPTEFQARAGITSLVGAQLLIVSAEQVAAQGYAALMRGDRLVVPGPVNRLVTMLPRILPRGFFLRQVARSQLRQAKAAKRP